MSAVAARTLQPIRGSGRSRYVLGALAALLAVAAAVAVAVVGSGSFGAPDPLPSATPVADAGGDGEGVAADLQESGDVTVGSVLPVATYEVFLSRDPFDPVVPEEEPVSPAAPFDPDTAPVPSDSDAPLPVLVPSDPDAPRCAGQEELVCDGQVVTLLETTTIDGAPVAVIQVGTTVHEVRVGETFAGSFLLVAIDPPSTTVLYGDESNVLSPGQSILK